MAHIFQKQRGKNKHDIAGEITIKYPGYPHEIKNLHHIR
jgi:hypothetical protein